MDIYVFLGLCIPSDMSFKICSYLMVHWPLHRRLKIWLANEHNANNRMGKKKNSNYVNIHLAYFYSIHKCYLTISISINSFGSLNWIKFDTLTDISEVNQRNTYLRVFNRLPIYMISCIIPHNEKEMLMVFFYFSIFLFIVIDNRLKR